MPSNGTSSSTSSSTSTSTSEDSLGTADPWQQHASSAQGDAPLVWAADDSAAQAASSLATDALDASALAAAHAHAWPTTSLALEGLALGHNTLGLPWWASIAAFSLTVRLLVMFPLKYVLEKRRRMLQLDEMAISHNEPTAVSEDERPDAEFRLTEEFAEMSAEEKAEHARMAEAIMKEYGPRERTLVLQMNMPSTVRSITWLSMLGGVSALMAAEVPSMSSGGALWFTDLTVPDTTLGLTMLSGALLLKATREWRLLFLKKDPSPFHVRSISFFNDLHRFVALAMVLIPAGFYLPAGTMLLGLFDGSLAMVQNRVVRTIVDHQVLMGSSSFAAFHKKQEDDNASAPPPPGDAPPSAGPGSPGG